MKTYRIYATRVETECSYVKANSEEEAKELADDNYDNYDWDKLDDIDWYISDIEEIE